MKSQALFKILIFSFLLLTFTGCASKLKSQQSADSKSLSFEDKTKLNTFLKTTLNVQMSSLVDTLCALKDKQWTCQAKGFNSQLIAFKEQSAHQFVTEHLSVNIEQLQRAQQLIKFQFLGCLEKEPVTICRIENLFFK